MVAELAYSNGKAQIFSVLQTPWHQEGHILTEAPTYEEAITLAGLDYPLEKRPHFRPVNPADLNAGYREAGNSYYVYRPDTNKVLGSVGSSYEVISNREAFEPLKPLVDEGILKLETGGVLRDGADSWMLGRWDLERFGPDVREVFGDEVLAFATVMANHNGRRGVLIGMTPIRICCANTLGMAETSGSSRLVNVAHINGAKTKLIEVAENIFQGVLERYEVVAKQYRLLKECTLHQRDFARLVLDIVAPDPRRDPKFNPEAKLAESVLERAERKREALTRAWTGGIGHVGDHSAWEAYQGCVQLLDHDRQLFPCRAGSWRTASLLTGQLATAKQEVVNGLVEHAMGV